MRSRKVWRQAVGVVEAEERRIDGLGITNTRRRPLPDVVMMSLLLT
jgi:hypothetical protein